MFLRLWGPALLVAAAIFAVSSLPARQLPPVGFAHFDKLQHALAYGLLAAAIARALHLRRPDRQSTPGGWSIWLAAVALGIAYGVTDELHQMFVPGRQPDLLDLLADAVGAAAGAAGWSMSTYARRSSRRPPPLRKTSPS